MTGATSAGTFERMQKYDEHGQQIGLGLDANAVVSDIVSAFRYGSLSHLIRTHTLEQEKCAELQIIVERIFEELDKKYIAARKRDNDAMTKFLIDGNFEGVSFEAVERSVELLARVALARKQQEIDATKAQ